MSRRSTTARSGRVLALLAVSALAVTACGGGGGDEGGGDSGPAETTPIDVVDLTFQPITAGKLTVCTAAPSGAEDPFRFKDSAGMWGGVDIDLMKAIATRFGLVMEVTEQPAENIWLAPKAGTCDVAAAGITIDPEVADDAVFSDKYIDGYGSLLVREADAATLNTLESLAGKKVGVLAGSGEEYATTNAPDLSVQAFADTEAMYAALESSQIDAVLHEFAPNAFRAKSKGGTVVSVTFEDLGTTEYGFAVAPESQDLLLAINESLNEFNATGVFQQIFDKYFTVPTEE